MALALAACSGAVHDPSSDPVPTALAILPTTATLYPGVPTTFQISGGNGSYIATSSDQRVIAVSGAVPASLTVVPADVVADTPVTLTVRDTANSTPATATLTVKATLIANTIDVIPETDACAPALCAGADAVVTATVTANGTALANRAVRFEVASGDFQFYSGSGLDQTTTVATDSAGVATARLRAGSSGQSAIVRAVDIASGASRTASFPIAQADSTLVVIPDTVTFTGTSPSQCAGSSQRATVFIFGGRPPYNVVTGGSPFVVSPQTVAASGGSFLVIPTGVCTVGAITVLDSVGKGATVHATNATGTTTSTPLQASPNAVDLTTCSAQRTVVLSGASGSYIATPTDAGLTAVLNGDTLTISRTPTTTISNPMQYVVVTSSGQAIDVNVTIDTAALACP